MHWVNDTRYPPIANIMLKSKYQKLQELLHVNENSNKDYLDNPGNRLYKVQPVLGHGRNNCILIEPERENSIDGQIIPAKTKCSGMRQFNLKTPAKWGFKNFVRAVSSGMMYEFFLYTDKVKDLKITGAYVVERLLETLPEKKNFKVFKEKFQLVLFSAFMYCTQEEQLHGNSNLEK